MSVQRITYFTAGKKPTSPELVDIANLNALVGSPYEVLVRNGAESNRYGYGPQETDFVAGTIPEDYEDEDEYPVFDVDALPLSVTVDNGDVLTMASGKGTATATVSEGAATYAFTEAATKELISHGDTLTLASGKGTATVAVSGGTPVYTYVEPATKKLISHGDVLTLAAGAGTVNVAISGGVATYTFVAP